MSSSPNGSTRCIVRTYEVMEFRLMGAIELINGLVVRYTDHLDTASLTTGMPAVAARAVRP
jgi:hypothetical protein